MNVLLSRIDLRAQIVTANELALLALATWLKVLHFSRTAYTSLRLASNVPNNRRAPPYTRVRLSGRLAAIRYRVLPSIVKHPALETAGEVKLVNLFTLEFIYKSVRVCRYPEIYICDIFGRQCSESTFSK